MEDQQTWGAGGGKSILNTCHSTTVQALPHPQVSFEAFCGLENDFDSPEGYLEHLKKRGIFIARPFQAFANKDYHEIL